MKCHSWKVFIFLLWISGAASQTLYECPLGWVDFADHCYHFIFYPTYNHRDAKSACQVDGAYLVSVNSDLENTFVTQWLTKHDQNKANQWWTSGAGQGQNFMWEGDGTPGSSSPDFWLNPDEWVSVENGQRVVFNYSGAHETFKLARQRADVSLPYVCEISLKEAYRVVQQDRDHMFGTDSMDPNDVPRGPKFIVQPISTVVAGDLKEAVIECDVQSTPHSTYTWYKEFGTSNQLAITANQHYTITNGKLFIQNPNRLTDKGLYQCVANNFLGSVISDPAEISFGSLAEFSNDPPGGVTARLHQGITISCTIPAYVPAVNVQWYKEDGGPNFLRTDLHPHLFVSKNGKMYISETGPMDAGYYHCFVALIAPPGQILSTPLNPSRTSLGIQLSLMGESAIDFGPEIHNDFPAVFPAPSLRGLTLTLECFAYGTMPLYYSWRRNNGAIPDKAEFGDHNRIITLPDAQIEDSGDYTCLVRKGNSVQQEKTLSLLVEASPFFIHPLKDQHIDIASPLTWRCEALGVPNPTYAWYKDGQPLKSVPEDIEVQGNILTIFSADPAKHPGMYQCSATNIYGTHFSSAQLRVLAFKPTFSKLPLNPSQFGTIGGQVTFICQPEAAPTPAISWQKDGRELVPSDDPDGRIIQLTNGNLIIRQLQLSDQGSYMCVATNSMGTASSTGLLTVVSATVINIAPVDTRADVNSTVFLRCEASYNANQRDLVYIWDLNGVPLDIERKPHYMKSVGGLTQGLYIINIQLYHEGLYTCSATTVSDVASASAYLQVFGPPGESGGLIAIVYDRNVTLMWTLGPDNRAPILRFHIEFNTNFNEKWRVLKADVPILNVLDLIKEGKCRLALGELKPGSSYRFRVIALNRYGPGPPSLPSTLYRIPDAAPIIPVTDVREGVGPVGTLPIEWDQLDRENLTGDGVGYRVYYRQKDGKDGLWKVDVVNGRIGVHAPFLGPMYYFLDYEVMIAPFNSLGQGPNSSVFVIKSAEDMPIAAAHAVYADSYNATAMFVHWTPIPNTREAARGNVLGYQINYWPMHLLEVQMDSTIVYCDCGEGMVVALSPNEDFWINVQVFTKAGMGPLSEDGFGSTYIFPPLHYPEYVQVMSHPGNAVFVTWRGVSTGLLEETIIGYKIKWWPATENIRTANETVIKERIFHGVVKGVGRGVVYGLRVMGYSAGGDGQQSPTVYFTLEGQVMYNPETTEIMNSSPSPKTHLQYFIYLILLSCTFVWTKPST